jgi:L-threonylcarbamoyladenylate synthase
VSRRPPREIDDAAAVLRRGGLVAFPTETVYGLGADAANPEALRRLYRVKGRPPHHPVIVHLGAPADLGDFALDVPDDAGALARAFWPGPLTLVLRRRRDRVADEATGGRDTVGLRVPAHPVALALLESFGAGVAAPSANRFGRVSPTTAAHVRADLGDDVDVVLDGGPCTVGVESTIVDLTGPEPRVLREGGVGVEQLERVLGRAVPVGGTTAAPGTLPSHYAPHARVEVVPTAREAAARVASHTAAGRRVGLLALLGDVTAAAPGAVVLEPPSDADEYARVLYARLREADRLGLDVLVAVAPPPRGIGAAVRDRLRRAAGG